MTLEKHKICIELFVKKYNNNLRLFVNKFLSLTSQVFNFFFNNLLEKQLSSKQKYFEKLRFCCKLIQSSKIFKQKIFHLKTLLSKRKHRVNKSCLFKL